MNILIIGGGGREHAIAWKIKQSPLCNAVYIAPGNPGTALVGINVPISWHHRAELDAFITNNDIRLVCIGPEDPLCDGLTDHLINTHPGLMVIGPDEAGAQLEGSKAFAKEFMEEFNIPTAKYKSFTADQMVEAFDFVENMTPPIVIKADGLAAGKGVTIAPDHPSALQEVKSMFEGKFGASSATVVIEEFLSGKEFSVFALTDGKEYKILPVAKDYKKVGEGDTGPNTGGMGAISPVPFVDDLMMQKVEERIIKPTIHGIHQRGFRYLGIVFFGLIEVHGEPYVIEYNCRMGDPETEVVMPRLKSDLVDLFIHASQNKLSGFTIEESDQAASTVMLVSGGYPGDFEKRKRISMDLPANDPSILFHAGTIQDDHDHVMTNGGRVMAITNYGTDIQDALAKSYNALQHISFDGMYFRKDIGYGV